MVPGPPEHRAGLDASDWTVVDVRDGTKGPLIVEAVKRRVVARTEKRQEGPSLRVRYPPASSANASYSFDTMS